jgi:hypothetical protein
MGAACVSILTSMFSAWALASCSFSSPIASQLFRNSPRSCASSTPRPPEPPVSVQYVFVSTHIELHTRCLSALVAAEPQTLYARLVEAQTLYCSSCGASNVILLVLKVACMSLCTSAHVRIKSVGTHAHAHAHAHAHRHYMHSQIAWSQVGLAKPNRLPPTGLDITWLQSCTFMLMMSTRAHTHACTHAYIRTHTHTHTHTRTHRHHKTNGMHDVGPRSSQKCSKCETWIPV